MKTVFAVVASVLVFFACGKGESITITSPASEATWQPGVAYSVSWETNLPGSSEIYIGLTRLEMGSSLSYPLYAANGLYAADGTHKIARASDGGVRVLVPVYIPRGDWRLAMSSSDGSVQTRSEYVIRVQ